jgi:hypothetical protein
VGVMMEVERDHEGDDEPDVEEERGRSKTSSIITARGQLTPAGLSSNTFDSQPAAFPGWAGRSSRPVALGMVSLLAASARTPSSRTSW